MKKVIIVVLIGGTAKMITIIDTVVKSPKVFAEAQIARYAKYGVAKNATKQAIEKTLRHISSIVFLLKQK